MTGFFARGRSLGSSICLSFFVFAGMLLAAEGSYRLYVHVAKPLYRPSSVPHLIWELTPGADHGVKFRVNELGFRDHVRGAWSPWNDLDFKIAVLGDSVTVGPGMHDSETYSRLIEQDLKRQGMAARVLNMGLDATNSRQHLALLEGRALQFSPDVILLGYFMNDTEISPWETLPAFIQELMRHFHFGVFLCQRVMQSLRNHRNRAWGREKAAGPSAVSACSGYVREILDTYQAGDWPRTADSIRRMALISAESKTHFGIVLFPFEDQVLGICPADAQFRIRAFLADAGIPMLDLLPVFKKAAGTKLYLPGDPIHLNQAGHRLAAQGISAWLLSEKWVKKSEG